MIRNYELIDKYIDIIDPETINRLLWFQSKIGYYVGHLPIVRPAIIWLEDFFTKRGRRSSKFARMLHWATGNSIFYLDYVGGSDAASGADWANAWKTLTLGATAARIAPGDVIRIAKSPAPTSLGMTAAWTDLSRTVTLNSALTAVIEDCEDAWVASANVTCTTSATNKEGTNSASIAIAAGFTTGKVAYEALAGSTDFSGYQQVSFWIRTSVAIAAGVLTLDLCSDTIGATSVNSIAIPAIPGTSVWQVVTVDTGAALGSAIQSISINAVSDPGAPTILIDNIIACKDSSAADSLTLSSLISKNSAEQGGAEAWHTIQSISGTTVILDAHTGTEAGTGRGYSGTTETVTTYKRETIKTTPTTNSTDIVGSVTDSGTLGSNIEYQGGYDTGTSLQTGETFFDGQNSNGHGISLVSKSFITLNYLNFHRYSTGINLSGSHNNTIQHISNIVGCGFMGISLSSSCNNYIGKILNCINCGTNSGMRMISRSSNNYIEEISNISGNGTGLSFSGSDLNTIVLIGKANNNASYGVSFFDSSLNKIGSIVTASNGTAGIDTNAINYIETADISESTKVTARGDFQNCLVFINKFNGTGHPKIFADGGNIVRQTSTLTNGSGFQWLFTTETNTNRQSNYPLRLTIAKIAVTANNLVTVKAWFLKGHATNIGAKLVCRGGQIAGVATDVTATKANDTAEEELTITFTPTEDGVVEIEAWAYYVAGHSTVIVDAMTITQA
ncbi:MAG: hypothetical protein WA082_04415 [Candidatus Moraniibacteriota bacterium]